MTMSSVTHVSAPLLIEEENEAQIILKSTLTQHISKTALCVTVFVIKNSTTNCSNKGFKKKKKASSKACL